MEANELRAYLVKLASGKVEKGILQEPRIFYDEISILPNQQLSAGTAEIFRNGEAHPIMLKHLAFAVSALDQNGQPDDPRNIAKIGLNFRWHDQFYMNPSFVPAPAWCNVHNAGPEPVVQSMAGWKFDVPFIMSARDTLKIDCQALVQPTEGQPLRFGVNLNGIGMLSGRPYLLTGEVDMPDQQETALPTQYLRNDGGEAIVLVDMTANLAIPNADLDPQADIATVAFNVRQIGAGTNAQWFAGPNNTGLPQLMPAHLFGLTTGRVIVHRFPGDGMMLNPGEAFSLYAQGLVDEVSSKLLVAAAGYVMVT